MPAHASEDREKKRNAGILEGSVEVRECKLDEWARGGAEVEENVS